MFRPFNLSMGSRLFCEAYHAALFFATFGWLVLNVWI